MLKPVCPSSEMKAWNWVSLSKTVSICDQIDLKFPCWNQRWLKNYLNGQRHIYLKRLNFLSFPSPHSQPLCYYWGDGDLESKVATSQHKSEKLQVCGCLVETAHYISTLFGSPVRVVFICLWAGYNPGLQLESRVIMRPGLGLWEGKGCRSRC